MKIRFSIIPGNNTTKELVRMLLINMGNYLNVSKQFRVSLKNEI